MNIIIAVPHVCVVSEILDPICDPSSYKFAQTIKTLIPRSVLVKSQNPRMICDNNRMIWRNSPMRNELRKLMIKPFVILEIRTFANGENWDLSHDPDIILLPLKSTNKTLLKKVYNSLASSFLVDILLGSSINDIQVEIAEKDGLGIIIELRQDLSTDKVSKIGKLLQDLF